MGVVTRICCNSSCHHVVPVSVLLRRMCQLSAPSLVPTHHQQCGGSATPLVRWAPTHHQQCGGFHPPATPLVRWAPTDHRQCGGFHPPATPLVRWAPTWGFHQPATPFLVLQRAPGHQQHRACLHTSSPRPISWKDFVLSVRVFGGGVKALYNDMKLMRTCISQYGGLKIDKSAPSVIGDGKTSLLYPRKDLQFMYRVWIGFMLCYAIILFATSRDVISRRCFLFWCSS